jgi:hypothetical protein
MFFIVTNREVENNHKRETTLEKFALSCNGVFVKIEYIIETYHDLTTSKTLQLRCFQSS